jgi:hypothetical protein
MERLAARSPGAYRCLVMALAVFGYLLLLALVIALLLLALLALGLRHATLLSRRVAPGEWVSPAREWRGPGPPPGARESAPVRP